MKKKQPVVIIVAGVVCATVAVFIVQRRLSRKEPLTVSEPGVTVLVAMREISFGDLLVLEGQGENANVVFAQNYPTRLKPDGAVTEQDRVTKQQMRAKDSFVKNEPVLEPRIVADADFVPPDMIVEKVSAEAEDVKSGRVAAGQKVDVFRMVGNTPTDFMRSVKVYGTETSDAGGRRGQSASALLLVRKADRMAFLKAKYAGQFLLVPAADPETEGPIMVDGGGSVEAQKSEVRAQLEVARELMRKGQHEEALAITEEARGKYPDLTDVNQEVEREIAECRRQLAEELYEDARAAVEQGEDLTTALRLVDRIESGFADVEEVVKKARALRQDAQKALSARRAQVRYEAVLTELPMAIDRGNLPLAEELVADLEQFREAGLKPEGGLAAPEAALAEFQAQLREAQGRYDVDKKVLESFLKDERYDQARVKLSQMRERFPAHPQVEELAKQVPPETTAGGQ